MGEWFYVKSYLSCLKILGDKFLGFNIGWFFVWFIGGFVC